MKIGNIVHESELINHVKVDYINYLNEETAYHNVDTTLPTLYVGWSFMKECNRHDNVFQNVNILNRTIISNQLFFEFTYKEDKQSHVNGVQEFVDNVPMHYFKPKHNYTNLDPIFFQIANIEDLMDALPKELDCFYVYKKEMVYVLKNNNIWGINLTLYSFFQFDIDEIITTLKSKSCSYSDDSEGITYQKYYKTFPDYEDLKKYIVTIQ
jgi:hypothetical protein